MKLAKSKENIRPPLYAGRFYPSNPEELRNELGTLFSSARKTTNIEPIAIITPHAGYMYSGKVAAAAFSQINSQQKYDSVFVLAASHHYAFNGAALLMKQHYATPLGEMESDDEIQELLAKDDVFISNRPEVHEEEHSIEVVLPFLQYHLKHDFKLIPIIIGTHNISILKNIAQKLKLFVHESVLFVISTDFSHYPHGEQAKIYDKKTIDAICSLNPDTLLDAILDIKQERIQGMATSLCGLSAVLTMLYMLEDYKNAKSELVNYMHSGMVSGDEQRVVGYASISIGLEKNDSNSFILTKKDKSDLLNIARKSIVAIVNGNKVPDFYEKDFSTNLNQPCGAFVTLKKNKELRGCIGRFEPENPLYEVVQDMAIASATRDNRFSKVKPPELTEIEIEISVLTPLHKIHDIDEIEIGKHGIYLKKGGFSGTLLPQVATENRWSRDEFLMYCSKYKAGLGENGWKDADLFVYEAIVFGENE